MNQKELTGKENEQSKEKKRREEEREKGKTPRNMTLESECLGSNLSIITF